MVVDANQSYFISGVHFKKEPKELGLVAQPQGDNLFVRQSDQSIWKKTTLFDYGWGDEVGFVRQPELSFDELWYLLFNSELQDNVYGAAAKILKDFPDQMLAKVEELLNQNTASIVTPGVKEKLLVLTLDRPVNRSSIIGKSYQQIQDDFGRWKLISQKVSNLK
jgi:hypothetical protein